MAKPKQSCLEGILPDVCLDVLEGLGTSRALSIAIAYRSGSLYDENQHLLDIQPSAFDSAHAYWSDAQAIALFKKNMLLSTSSANLSDECVVRFFEIESINKATNLSLAARKNFRANSLIYNVSRIIERVIGLSPPVDRYRPLFGPGSTYTLPANQATVADKLDCQLDATPLATIYLQECRSASPRLFEEHPTLAIVPGNRFSQVAKDYRKNRPISIEPCFNMLLQKNIGEFIRHRLRRVGIDIATQQEFHRFLLANYHNVYATIDQSDASDRISIELIRQVLPHDWFVYLDRIRSHRTVFSKDGKVHELQKFASQGNGFIFELETLVFYAIAQATCEAQSEYKFDMLVSAYGDDVIVPEQFFEAVCQSYELVGFAINREKSFSGGRFKESCGYDVFDGFPVRPTYLKDYSNGLAGLYEAANHVTRIASHHIGDVGYSRVFKRAWLRILSHIPANAQCGGPEYLGDTVLHGANWKVKNLYGITYVKSIKRLNAEKLYRVPTRDNALLAYMMFWYPSRGVLPRSAPFNVVVSRCVTRTLDRKVWM